MRKLFLPLLCFLMLSLYSCSDDLLLESQTANDYNKEVSNRKASEDDNYLYKKKFAIALHKAMKENAKLREFLKLESQKQFNKDYDILYGYIHDKLVGDVTFRETLLPYFENEEELINIENTIETLTIFIPSLPNNSFSAETWNTANDVPLVAIRLLNNEKTPLISSDGESYLLDHDVIPGFPVVVIKENERIIVPSFPNYYQNEGEEYSSNIGFKFKFAAEKFNNIKPIRVIDGTPEDLIAAWEINGRKENIGWQRDHIYYSIHQNNPDGPFINNHSEFIRNFKMEGDPLAALNFISQPSSVNSQFSDPELVPVIINPSGGVSQGSFWTDGYFEFNVYLEYSDNQAPLEKGFSAKPEDLFHITYKKLPFRLMDVYVIEDLRTKTYPLNLDMLTWRLHDYSNNWKFTFEEIDLNVKITSNESYTEKFNTNFSFDTGELLKIGMKFGSSNEETRTSAITRTWTEESNDLKSTYVHFGDNVIIDETTLEMPNFIPFNYRYYKLKRYTTGRVSFSLAPMRVQ